MENSGLQASNDFTILFEKLEEVQKDENLAPHFAIDRIELHDSIKEIRQIVESFQTPYDVTIFTKS